MKARLLLTINFLLVCVNSSFAQQATKTDTKPARVRSAEQIRETLNKPVAEAPSSSRSIKPDAPATPTTTMRKGLRVASGTRSYSLDGKPALTRDFTEVSVETDVSAKIDLPAIEFKVGSTIPLNKTAELQLAELAKFLLAANPTDKFLIEGHTCPKGGNDINNPLSVARAQWVVDFLKQKLVNVELQYLGCGSSDAAANSMTSESPEEQLIPFRKVMLHKIRG